MFFLKTIKPVLQHISHTWPYFQISIQHINKKKVQTQRSSINSLNPQTSQLATSIHIGRQYENLKVQCFPGRSRPSGWVGRLVSMRLSSLLDEWYLPGGPCCQLFFVLRDAAFPSIEPFHFATGLSSVQWIPFFSAGASGLYFEETFAGNTGHGDGEDLLWPWNGLS